MTQALVEPSGRIAQVEAIDTDIFPIAPPLQWVPVPPGTTTRDRWNGFSVIPFVPTPPRPVEETEIISEDIERLLRGLGVTRVEINIAKNSRGDPRP